MQRRHAMLLLVIVALSLVAGACTDRGGTGSSSTSDAGDGQRASDDADALEARGAGESTTDRATSPVDPRQATLGRARLIVDAMDVREQAGVTIMTKLVGTEASEEELRVVRERRVGGIILFGSNVADEQQLRALIGSLDGAYGRGAGGHLLVSVDQEGGSIRNIPFTPPADTQPALGGGGDLGATRSSAAATGAALAALGIDMSLGPVADLDAGPNHTMRGRSFGARPGQVGPHVAAAVEGLQSGGVAATTKHFPGFGASTANSDEAVAHVDRTMAELRRDELRPFAAAIRAGTEAIMVSHGIHRELGSKLPGTLDPRIATDLLRGELRFEGVAMTDSMNAVGLREAWGDTVPRACPVAIAAGIDIVLLTGSIETARLCGDRIVEAVEAGSLPAARLEEAAVRVVRLQLQAVPASTAALPVE